MLYLEIIGAVIGLLYLWFEYRASIWLWPVGIVMPVIYIYIFYTSAIYANMTIQIYYFGASLYGWAIWLRKRNDDKPLPITRTPTRAWLPMAGVFLALFAVLVFILKNFTDSTVPWVDSFTTALSMVALWMLARKYVEQWLVWVVVNVVCAELYFHQRLYPTAALYAIYSVAAVFGYFKWLKMTATSTETAAYT